jgi:uncharacterized repeat protein (TIGR01451 family)
MNENLSTKYARLLASVVFVFAIALGQVSDARRADAVRLQEQPERRRTVLVSVQKIKDAKLGAQQLPIVQLGGSEYVAMSYEVPTPSYAGITSGSTLPSGSPVKRPGSASDGLLSPASSQGFFLGVDFDDNVTYNSSRVFIPPDPIAAAGPDHLVSVVNAMIAWYTKDGTSPNVQALSSFFATLTPLTATFDPKVIYDQYNDRFVVIALEMTSSPSPSSRIFLAVSDDSDPNGTWYFQQINSLINIGGTDHWADYPGFAVGPNAIYIALNMFTFSDTSGGSRLWIVDKGAGSGGLYDGGTSSVTVHNPYSSPALAMTHQPAHTFDALPGNAGTFLVGYSGLAAGALEFMQVIRVDDPLGTPAFDVQFVPLGDIDDTAASLQDAPQQGTATRIEVNDRRTLNAVWRNNSLYTSTTVEPSSGPDVNQTTAHWVQIDTTNLAALTVAQQGSVGGENIAPGTFTFFPAVMVDNAGNVGIGFSASAATTFAGAYFTRHHVTDAAGTTRAAETVKAGEDFYIRTFGGSRNRWGDFSGIALDPVDGTFWVYNEYAMTRGTPTYSPLEDGRWATAFGNFPLLDYGDAPDPTYPTLLASDGARHIMDGIAFLGNVVDEDLDGQPNATATGDDDGSDDEDGVALLGTLNAGISANLLVTASVGGVLSTWIDFNADGDWDDAGEQAFADESLSAGSNALVLSVPTGASVGQTYARFRFSTQAGLMPTGLAADGEVEDYQVNVIRALNVAIAKTVNPQTNVEHHGTVTYTLVLSNTGLTDDPRVLLTDTLPSEVDFGAWIKQPSAASVNNDEIAWSGTLSTGVAITFTFTATHVGDYGETVTNTAQFSGTAQASDDTAAFTVTSGAPKPPALVSPPDGTITSTMAPTLTWSPVANAAGYLLDWSGTVTDVGNVTEYGTGVLANGTYTWAVAAYDVFSRTSTFSDVWTFTINAYRAYLPLVLRN